MAPLTDVKVLNGGSNFDVINLTINNNSSSRIRCNSIITTRCKRRFKEVLVDQQGFDIEDVLSVSISGGNGTGAVLKPVVRRRFREMKFDGRTTAVRGGIDVLHDQLIFSEPHNLLNGEPLVYDNNENPSLGVGIFSGSNLIKINFYQMDQFTILKLLVFLLLDYMTMLTILMQVSILLDLQQ